MGQKTLKNPLLFYEKNVDAVNNDDDDDEANLIYDHGGFKNTTFSHVNRPSFLFVIIIGYIQREYRADYEVWPSASIILSCT